MSRAYRIRVQETLRRVLRAQDGVSTQLELLEILPPEPMGQLLADELERRGFVRDGTRLEKKLDGINVSVDVATGTVSVQAEASAEVCIEDAKERRGFDDVPDNRKKAEHALRQELRKDLEQRADAEEGKLQSAVTDRLEAQLVDLRKELDQVVNRVTAEALKLKAATLGQIKELTEDPQSGSLTIVLEV